MSIMAQVALVAAATLVMTACGGGDNRQPDTAPASGAVMGATSTPTAATPGASPQVALGDSIFRGQAAGGICYTCHGPDAKGTALGPNLTDSQWLNVDGSLESIQNVVRNGVPTPKQYPGPMPAFGQMLTPQQVSAVAAYVYSLRNPASS